MSTARDDRTAIVMAVCTSSARSATTRPGPSEGWPTYMADWRERNPAAVDENRLRTRARQRAKVLLAEMHADDYSMLYDETLAAMRAESAPVGESRKATQ